MKDNGCEGSGEGYKPYKVVCRLTTTETRVICMKEGEDVMDAIQNAISVRDFEPCTFEWKILEKEEVENAYDDIW